MHDCYFCQIEKADNVKGSSENWTYMIQEYINWDEKTREFVLNFEACIIFV